MKSNKNTHTVQDIEKLMYEYTIKIRNAETKTEKQALLKKLKSLEQHYNSCKEKEFNGKKYPVKKVPKDMPKKELLALIDSVATPENSYTTTDYMKFNSIDESGLFIKGSRT